MMKSFLNPLLIVMALLVSGCSGQVDPDEQKEQDLVPTAPYTLTIDKNTIEADGSDAAVLRIIDVNGLDLTGEKYLRNTSFHIEETGEYFSGMIEKEPNVFRSITDGTYNISAMYEGKQCENSVIVNVQNRSKYEVFHKNVAIYRLTATWCQYCPSMTEALDKMSSYTKNHSIVLGFHNDDEYSVAYSSTDLADMLLNRFSGGGQGYPYCIYSLYEGSGKRTVNDIQGFVKRQLYDNPAKTGIKAESYLDNGSIKVNATVKASASGRYDLGIALLEDNCIPTSSVATEGVYNSVVRAISGNFFAMATDSFDLEANAEKQILKTIEASLSPSDLQNYRVVLFTLRESGGKVIIDNVVDFQLGKNVEYVYN